jgi:hypothetical protein
MPVRFHWCRCRPKGSWRRSRKTALADLRYPLLAQAALPRARKSTGRSRCPNAPASRAFSARHLHHQGKPHLRPGARRRPEGNGDTSLCNFGEHVTPNEHKLVRDFVLLDNTYCCGILSADGHQWTDTGIATDYVEREFAGWPRSYPAGGFGEAAGTRWPIRRPVSSGTTRWRTAKRCAISANSPPTAKHWKDSGARGKPHFLDCYHDFTGGSNAIAYTPASRTSKRCGRSCRDEHHWLGSGRAGRVARGAVHQSLKQFEAADSLPNLVILWLPNDHTSATARFTHARGAGGGQRPGGRPNGRGREPFKILDEHLHLRRRGRPAERLGPRQRLSHDGLCRQRVHETRRGRPARNTTRPACCARWS